MLWQWCRLAATTLIRPLAWELPYALGVALKRPKEKKKKKKEPVREHFRLGGPRQKKKKKIKAIK